MLSTGGAAPTVQACRCAALVMLLAARLAHADWIFDGKLESEYDDNVPRAISGRDVAGDFSVNAEVAPGTYFQLTDRLGFTLAAPLSGSLFADFDGLNNVSAGLSAALRAKLGLGPEALWIRAAAGASWYDFDHALRDSWRYRAALNAGRWIGTRWQLQIGYAFDRRRATEVEDIPFLVTNFGIPGDAFDGDAHTLSLAATYTITPRLAGVLGYARRMGDVTATTRRDFEVFEYSDAIAADPVFGPDRVAYRVDVDTDVYTAGLSYALGQRGSLNLGYEVQHGTTHDIAYDNHIVRIGLLYSY